MIRLAWSRLRHRPARGLLVALPAAALGALAAPAALFALAAVLYVAAAVLLTDGRAELRALSWVGWPWRRLAGAVLAEYAMAGVLGAAIAAAAALLPGTATGALAAAGLALAAALLAGLARAASAVRLIPDAERSRPA
ncbi:MAG TPA: hypothetical protein VF069_12475 [Streptosporangiaceae bacterium]